MIGKKRLQIQHPARSISFHDLSLQSINERFVLGFSALGHLETFSEPFVLSPGNVVSLSLFQQPGNGTGDSVLSPQPIVELLDSGHNTVVGASGTTYKITASIKGLCTASEIQQTAYSADAAKGRFDGSAPPNGTSVQGNSSIHPLSGRATFTDISSGATIYSKASVVQMHCAQ